MGATWFFLLTTEKHECITVRKPQSKTDTTSVPKRQKRGMEMDLMEKPRAFIEECLEKEIPYEVLGLLCRCIYHNLSPYYRRV